MVHTSAVLVGDRRLPGELCRVSDARGLVIFAHGSGSSRHSRRNVQVARSLQSRGLCTLLFDLLTPGEEGDRANVFDIPLLAGRVAQAVQAMRTQLLPTGLFGASTGAAAALLAASRLPQEVQAVVSRGGRPDLAGDALAEVRAPTLLIVGAADTGVVELNQQAYRQLRCEKRIELVPRATHLFEEAGTLDQVSRLAGDWFVAHLFAAG